MESNGKWGYIDKTGNWAIQPQFDQAGLWGSGITRVRVGDHYGFIDQRGKWVVEPIFINAGNFVDDLALVYEGNTLGYINKKGKYVWRSKVNEAYTTISQ